MEAEGAMTDEIFRRECYAKSSESRITAVDALGVRLDRTVFYPAGGGQPGDTGVLRLVDGRQLQVVDTVKHPETGEPVHVLPEGTQAPPVGAPLVAEIDWGRRYGRMQMHTCMHLLCSLIPEGVTGGSLGDDRARLDFDLPERVLDKDQLTVDLNRLIAEDHPVVFRSISIEELKAKPELVRTMSVKPPMNGAVVRLVEIVGVDLQPCGGTHVASTGEIGRVKVTKIENKGRHNRRVSIAFDHQSS